MADKDEVTLPVLVFDKTEWQADALCKEYPEVNFFNDSRTAKQICQMCAVKQECLEFAIKNDIRDGVWGGMLHKERKTVIL